MRSITINKEQASYIRESIVRDSIMDKISDTIRKDIQEGNTPISLLPIPTSLNKKIIEDLLVSGYNHAKDNFTDDVTSVPLDKVVNKLNKLIAVCKKKEENLHAELEKLCIDIATSYFNIDGLDDVTLECRLVNDLSNQDFHIEPNTMSELTYEDINQYKDSEVLITNRKLSNIISMGGALNLYEQLQDKFIPSLFKFDEELPHLYSKILKINEYLMYVSDYEISDWDNHQSGCVNVTVNEHNGNEIVSVGTLFPFLLVETFRGYLELLSDKMLTNIDGDIDSIIDKCDILKDEPWQMIIGPQLWNKIVGDNVEDSANVISELYNMKPDEFSSFMSEVLANTNAGTEKIKELHRFAQYDRDYSQFEKDLERKREEHNLILGNV